MHKLVILVETLKMKRPFDEVWPEFLQKSEQMPGLRREATCRVEHLLYGNYQPYLLHELFFDSVAAIQTAMSSPEGLAAGQVLQQMTGGRVALVIADHKEDNLENIRKHRQKSR
jgi:uncharacterized protein (TIGR02118 family)